jgi:antitoxin component YwqK of YwqJK toxin-antitoxin module
MNNKYFILLFAIFGLVFSGCKTYNRVFKGEDYYQNITVTQDDSIIQAHVITKDINIDPNENTTYYWYVPNEIHWNEGGYTGNLLHGQYLLLDRDKNLLIQGCFNKGVKSNQWKKWYADGNIQSITEYKDGKKHGTHKLYSPDGDTIIKEHYKDGLKHGKQITYLPDNVIIEEYKYGEKIEKNRKGFCLFRLIGSLFSGKNKNEIHNEEEIEKEETEKKEFEKNTFPSGDDERDSP